MKDIILKMRGFTYIVQPNIQGMHEGHYQVLGLRLYDENHKYMGYWLWDYIPEVARDHVEAELRARWASNESTRQMNYDILNGKITRNSRLP